MAKLKTLLLDEFSKWPEWNSLTELQKEFFRKFFQRKNIFLTGPAGTGKSYAVNLLFRFLFTVCFLFHFIILIKQPKLIIQLTISEIIDTLKTQ